MSESRTGAIVLDIIEAWKQLVEKHGITQQEYWDAVKFIVAAVEQGEGYLLPDAFLEAIVVRNQEASQQGTLSQILGPYHIEDAPILPDGKLAADDEPGERLTVRGIVRDVDGKPLSDAIVDFWQADAEGRYSNFDPAVKKGALRGKIRTPSDGQYQLHTIVPAPYMIPHKGPTGRVLEAIGRHPWRPAHIHLIASREGYRTLTTQIYFDGDQYLDSDSVRGATRDLAYPLESAPGGKTVDFNIELEPA